jgi:hypothetical protein
MRRYIGELGFALILLISLAIGLHFAAIVLLGVSPFGVFYWTIPFAVAVMLAATHPHPHRRRFRVAR